jgi:cytochrome c peroxidase
MSQPGIDFYKQIVSLAEGIPFEMVTDSQRRIAKTACHSLHYGGTDNPSMQTYVKQYLFVRNLTGELA